VSGSDMGVEDDDRHSPLVLGLCGGRGTSHDSLENAMALLGFFLSALLNAKGYHTLYGLNSHPNPSLIGPPHHYLSSLFSFSFDFIFMTNINQFSFIFAKKFKIIF